MKNIKKKIVVILFLHWLHSFIINSLQLCTAVSVCEYWTNQPLNCNYDSCDSWQFSSKINTRQTKKKDGRHAIWNLFRRCELLFISIVDAKTIDNLRKFVVIPAKWSAMADNKTLPDGTRIKTEPVDSQFAEADSSTNSTTATSNGGETITRQNSLQRIQLRKERVSRIDNIMNVLVDGV